MLTFSPTAIRAAISSPKRIFLSIGHHTCSRPTQVTAICEVHSVAHTGARWPFQKPRFTRRAPEHLFELAWQNHTAMAGEFCVGIDFPAFPRGCFHPCRFLLIPLGCLAWVTRSLAARSCERLQRSIFRYHGWRDFRVFVQWVDLGKPLVAIESRRNSRKIVTAPCHLPCLIRHITATVRLLSASRVGRREDQT